MQYDGLSHYNDLVFLIKRPKLNPIFLAKEEHGKGSDRHIFKCKLVPKNIF